MVLIDCFCCRFGGGHEASAKAVHAVLSAAQPSWKVRLIYIEDVVKDTMQDLQALNDLYNSRVLHSHDRAALHELSKFLNKGMESGHWGKQWATAFESFWRREGIPNVVLSFNNGLSWSYRRTLKALSQDSHMITVLTDFTSNQMSENWVTWFDAGPYAADAGEQFWVCGTDMAAKFALNTLDYPVHSVVQTSGMVVRPDFYHLDRKEAPKLRHSVGLASTLLTVLLFFGGTAPDRAADMVRALVALKDIQVIVVCGRNAELATKLRSEQPPAKCHVLGFSNNIPTLMQMSDVMIGKPGPGTVSEALVAGLPVVVERGRQTMIQERCVADYVEKNGLGFAVKDLVVDASASIQELLLPGILAGYQDRVKKINNNAVFEVVALVQQLCSQGVVKVEEIKKVGRQSCL